MNKLIISILLMVGLVGMIGTATADQINIFEPLTFVPGTGGAFSGTAVTSVSLVPGGAAVIKDLEIWSFNQPAGTQHQLTTVVAPLGLTGLPGDIIIKYQEKTPAPGPLAQGPYNWWQDMGQQTPAPSPTVHESLDIHISASPNAVPGEQYQVQVTDDNGLPLTVKVTIVTTAIPEFQTIAIPIAAVLGLMFIIGSRKKKE